MGAKLRHAHQNQLIHRDVKPANVLLAVDGALKVTDFGLARARAAAGENTARPPGRSVLAGYGGMTPAYCSPEQALAAEGHPEALTQATDVWSWALSVLEMFMGHPPTRRGQAGAEVLAAFLDSGRSEPQIPAMPEDLASLLRRCFETEPAERPADMGEVADVLIHINDQTSASSYARSRPEAADLLADGLSNQALSMLDLGHGEHAQALWERALHADRHHLHTIYNRGLDRWRRAEMTDQVLVAELEAVRTADPHDWTVGHLLGRVHQERGDLDAALEVVGTAARMAPDDAAIHGAIRTVDGPASQARNATHLEHDGIVTAVALAADGRRALTGSADGSMRLWELRRGFVLCELPACDGYLCSVALTADGRRAVAGFRNGLVQVRDLYAEADTQTLQPGRDDHDDDYQLAASAGGRIVVSASPASMTAWEVPAGRCIHRFSMGNRSVRSVAVSADGLWGFVGGDDGMLNVWELGTGDRLRAVKADELLSAAVSVDGSHSLVGGADGTATLWDLHSGRSQRMLRGHSASVQAVAMSANSGLALTASTDGTARVWELDHGRCLRTIEDITCAGLGWHDRRIALSTDGRVALSGQTDPRIIRVWDLQRARRAPWSYTRPKAWTALTNDAVIARGRLRHASRLIDEGEPAAASAELRAARELHGYERNRSLLDQWRRAGRHGRRFSLRDGWHLRDLPADPSTSSVALSPDGGLALTSAARGPVSIYEVPTGALLRTVNAHGLDEGDAHPSDTLLAVSPEGELAVSGDGWTGTIRVWEIESGRCLGIGTICGRSMDMVAVTADGRLSLTGSRGLRPGRPDAIELWDTQTGSVLRTLGDSQWPCAVALSPDGRLGLSSTAGATTVRVWDIQSARCISTLRGHEGSVEAVAVSADGRSAVSGGGDHSVRVWELETGRCLRTLDGHTQPIRALALSADSNVLISASLDGKVRVWELDWEYEFPASEDWVEQARPYLEMFLRTRALLHPGSPLTQNDRERFAEMLKSVGFGWLSRSAVVSELGAEMK